MKRDTSSQVADVLVPTVLALFALAASGTAVAVDAGPPSGLNVKVVNPTSSPVPVTLQGTSTISGNVNVTNTPNVNVVNTPTVQVSGTVQTQLGIPANAFSTIIDTNKTGVLVGPDPANTSYAITSFIVENDGDTPVGGVQLLGYYGTTADCVAFTGTFTNSLGPQITAQPHTTLQLVFSQPFVISPQPGAMSCLREVTATGNNPTITVVGFRF